MHCKRNLFKDYLRPKFDYTIVLNHTKIKIPYNIKTSWV